MAEVDPGFFHLSGTWVRARKGRRIHRDVIGYMRRNRKRNVRARTPVENVESYMARRDDFEKASADVVYHTFRNRGSGLSSEELWLAVDRANRRKDGQYKQHAGRMPRLASFVTASLPYGCTLASAIDAVEAFLDFLEEEFGVAVEAVIHQKDGQFDHAHFLMTDCFVDHNGVGAKNRKLNAVASKAAGNGIIDGDTIVAPAMEGMRSCWAELIRRIAPPGSRTIDHRNFERRGLEIEPCISFSQKEILKQRLEGDEWWRKRRGRQLALRKDGAVEATVTKQLEIATATNEQIVPAPSVSISIAAMSTLSAEQEATPHLTPTVVTKSEREIAASILAHLKTRVTVVPAKQPQGISAVLAVRAAADWLGRRTSGSPDEHAKAAPDRSSSSLSHSIALGGSARAEPLADSVESASLAATTAAEKTAATRRAETRTQKRSQTIGDRALPWSSRRFSGGVLPVLSRFMTSARSGSSAPAIQAGLQWSNLRHPSAEIFKSLRSELRRRRRDRPGSLLRPRPLDFMRRQPCGQHGAAKMPQASSNAPPSDHLRPAPPLPASLPS